MVNNKDVSYETDLKMPRIQVSAIAHAYSDDPANENRLLGEDLEVIHGMFSEQNCLEELPESLMGVVTGGGRVLFMLDAESDDLRVWTIYEVTRALEEEEVSSFELCSQ